MPDTKSLEELGRQIRVCTDCALSSGRTHAVPGEGPADSQIMFIGEGPGYHEDRQGRPFVGPAGKFLDELLASRPQSRAGLYRQYGEVPPPQQPRSSPGRDINL